jgi:hypothetical protein
MIKRDKIDNIDNRSNHMFLSFSLSKFSLSKPFSFDKVFPVTQIGIFHQAEGSPTKSLFSWKNLNKMHISSRKSITNNIQCLFGATLGTSTRNPTGVRELQPGTSLASREALLTTLKI